MDLCKQDTNMSIEINGIGSVSQQGNEAGMPLIQKELILPPPSALNEPHEHLKCTCLPSNAGSDIDAQNALEASAVFAEVSTASHNSKVHFNDEIQVVRSVEEKDEEDIVDLAQALYAAGVRPELLASISEENIFQPEDASLSDENEVEGGHQDVQFMWSEYEQPQPLIEEDEQPRLGKT